MGSQPLESKDLDTDIVLGPIQYILLSISFMYLFFERKRGR